MSTQEKWTPEELESVQNVIFGLAMPGTNEPGFLVCFGIFKKNKFVLIDEFSSDNVLELADMVSSKMTKFDFRIASSLLGGDFLFGDRDTPGVKVRHSSVLLDSDRDKPFLLLQPKIEKARQAGEIVIADDWLLSTRLKSETLQCSAAIKFGDNPAFEALCFAYFGWLDLVRSGSRPPRQKNASLNKQ